MRATDKKPLYRHTGVALLRAAAAPLTNAPDHWPDLTDPRSCRTWLDTVWSSPRLADAVRQASPSLGAAVDTIRSGHLVEDKQIRSATLSTARYLLRSIGRPTPFGLFAGVAPVELGAGAQARWGEEHRAVARVNTEWLADIITRAEGCPELLRRLRVVVTDLAVRRGGRFEVPQGPNRVTVRHTPAIAAVQDKAAVPVRFGVLIDTLAVDFAADRSKVQAMLTELVRSGYLLTNLRAPFTVTDPFTHLMDQLHETEADTLPDTAAFVRDLNAIHVELHHHNHATTTRDDQRRARATITASMRQLSPVGRTPLAVDLMLDCEIRLPHHVAHEMERAAGALLRLTRQPTGEAAWRNYHSAFIDRYGAGTLVPLADVIDPDTGLGFPAGYQGSVLPASSSNVSERDERLLALAWQALATGTREIILTDDQIGELTGTTFDEHFIPPHVELSARVHATSAAALDAGDFLLTVAPARSAGTLTSRFTPMATGTGLADAYRALPAATVGALRAQMSFGPLYPHAENVCRVPAYLDHLLPLGEHRAPGGDHALITVDDLAITATRDRLHLVSRSRRRVVEPQVFHALALNKQPPLIARFLAHLPRAFSAAWYQFDWGPHLRLPFLPQVRYRRTILSPAQWRLTTADLPASPDHWRPVLDRWRQRWSCPDVVELRDADRTLRLTLNEPTHASLLRTHLTRHGQAILHTATPADDFGWIGGHAHEIALPLVTTRPAAPDPLRGQLPEVTNTHGHLPGAPDATWLSAKVFTHPERITEIVTEYLPDLLTMLGTTSCWWLRYRDRHETDHLRLRVQTSPDRYAACTKAVGEWTRRMRQKGLVGRLVYDTYRPEIGRYGSGPAMDAAEDVFAADSATVAAVLRHRPGTDRDLIPFVVANMVGIVDGLFGDRGEAMNWLGTRPVPSTPAIDRAVTDQAIRLAIDSAALAQVSGWDSEIGQAWQDRTDALVAYREHLPPEFDIDVVVESLLHMHHNRVVGIAPDTERICRRLSRQAALAWRARQEGSGQ
ncbi:lantibiotic dehydratase [Actinokineospora iranica]|uniref:Thiopeptide-type bacteriocin biosynthesis domain-containing protein n=1 Tax=Actinokineospora iranica TaxID=1271860 RepID=A0A1G6P116_9PSEU|nr:lantibiotic dehydratase [Actinokineospora iranica]SDC73883.1 thiopeptide-type bacteriocin biosynthesis domain-containing protein [Actinokineospora iranica]